MFYQTLQRTEFLDPFKMQRLSINYCDFLIDHTMERIHYRQKYWVCKLQAYGCHTNDSHVFLQYASCGMKNNLEWEALSAHLPVFEFRIGIRILKMKNASFEFTNSI